VFDIPFVVSGSTWLTALSMSKGYRTANGRCVSGLLRPHRIL